jgi:hypothetical protein
VLVNGPVEMARGGASAMLVVAPAPSRWRAPPAIRPPAWPEGCNNLDPVTQSNCSQFGYAVSGHTVTQSEDNNEGVINLMYQRYCEANWAEADSLSPHVYMEVFNTEGQYILYQPNYNWGYTSMVNGVPNAGVCIIDQYDNHASCNSQPGTYPTCVIPSLFGATFYSSSGVTVYQANDCGN